MVIHRNDVPSPPDDGPDKAALDLCRQEMLQLMKATLRDAENGDEDAKQILLTYLANKTIQQTIAIFAAAGLGVAQPTQSM